MVTGHRGISGHSQYIVGHPYLWTAAVAAADAGGVVLDVQVALGVRHQLLHLRHATDHLKGGRTQNVRRAPTGQKVLKILKTKVYKTTMKDGSHLIVPYRVVPGL